MPFLRGDPEAYQELLDEVDPELLPPGAADHRPSGEYEYEPAEAQFDPRKLDRNAKITLDALLDIGATIFSATYDGGYDEGFAHAHSVSFADGTERPAEAVVKQVATKLASAFHAQDNPRLPYGMSVDTLSDERLVHYVLDEFAHELASLLLCRGYGTGEYSLYGAFTADLRMGQITDHPDAVKPYLMD